MKKMMSQIATKHVLDNKILLKLKKIFNYIEINPNSTYPLSEPSVQSRVLQPFRFNNLFRHKHAIYSMNDE